MSLDGYIADEHGDFQWAAPDAEVHAYVNDLERPIGTYLYGRAMYEVMRYWEDPANAEGANETIDYGELWRAADKIVFSRTLDAVTTERTRLDRDFGPEAVRALKAAADRDLSIGGANLAAVAFRAGLVDECHFLLTPIIVGGGNPALH